MPSDGGQIQENEIECLIRISGLAFPQAREMIWHPRDFHLRAGHIEMAAR